MPQKTKALTLNLACTCGQAFMAIWKTGVKSRRVPCPRCAEPVNANGQAQLVIDREKCPWCLRLNWLSKNKSGCYFCAYVVPK